MTLPVLSPVSVTEHATQAPKQPLAETTVEHVHADLIAGRLPAWFKRAQPGLRETLRQTMHDWYQTQTEVAAVYARIQPIEQFAEPLLRAALVARGWGWINPNVYGLKQVRLFKNPIIFIANQQIKLVDTLVRKILPTVLIPESLELDLVSSISRHSLLQAALQNFEDYETRPESFDPGSAIFSHQHNQVMEHPEWRPETFASVCRDLNIGEQYQAHLSRVFNPPNDRFPASDPRSAAHRIKASFSANKRHEFMAELYMAIMKGHLSQANYEAVRRGVSPDEEQAQSGYAHSTLEVMGFEVPGAIVLWPNKQPAERGSPCVVYLPQCPKQTFLQFPGFYQFKQFLMAWLKRPEFARYFVTLVPLRYRAEFIRRIDIKEVAWDSLLLNRPLIIRGPAIISESRYIPQRGDPFDIAWRLQLAQIKDDARLLAVPTADEDVKSRLERQVAYLNAGLSVLTLALGFVPVLGEIMLAFGVLQVGADIYQGIKAWQSDDRVKALNYLFDVAQNVALVAIPGVVKGLKPRPEPVVDGLHQVTLGNGQKLLWRPDLTPYKHKPYLLMELEPDAQGIYTKDNQDFIRIDDAVYRVKVDRTTRQGHILHPDDPTAYTPKLRGNARGGWVHELENPLHWSRQQLFQRLGPETQSLSAETTEHILQITRTSEDVLRRVHMDNLPLPPLLADCIKRVSLSEQVEAFMRDMKAGIDSHPEYAPMQLDLLTRLPGWPADRVLRVLDEQGVIVSEYGHDLLTTGPRLQIAQAQIDNGELLKVTLEELPQAYIDQMLGEPVAGLEQQIEALARKIGEATPIEQAQLVSRLYSRSETITAPLTLISQQLPGLPVGVLEELSAHLSSKEVLRLTEEGRLPLHILEEARAYRQIQRLNRAFEGLFYETLSNADSDTLLWQTLPTLDGWSKAAHIELYSADTGAKLGGMGDGPPAYRVKLDKRGDTYQYYDGLTGQTYSSPYLMQTLFRVLTVAQREALNLPRANAYSVFRFRVANLAVQQHSSSAQALGMQQIKPWFKSPMRLADGRLGYTLGGRSGHLLSEGSPRLLKYLVTDLYPTLSDAEVGQYLYRLRLTPELAARKLVRLKAELQTLQTQLDAWVGSEVWTQSAGGSRVKVSQANKQAISLALLRAWRRQTPRVILENHMGYELNLDAWPVDSLPSLTADFSHVSALHVSDSVSSISSGFLERFSELRVLSVINSGISQLPPSISNMPQLIDLNLQGNQIVLSHSAAVTLSKLSKLRSLNLTGNPIGGTFSVRKMAHLQNLILRYTELQGWPEGVETLTQLRMLDLRNNGIREIPARTLTPEWAPINRVTSLHDNPLNPQSLRRLEQYRREHGINLGVDIRREHVVQTRGIYHWASPPTAEQSRQWKALHQTPDSADFFRVLEDLSGSSQFSHTRNDLTQRVWTLLGAVHDNEALRTRMFTLARSPRTCADGIAMIFADMELSYQLMQAETSANTEQQLLRLARGLFRIEVLNGYVLRVIETRIEAIKTEQLDYVGQLQALIDAGYPELASKRLVDMEAVEQQGQAYRVGTPEALKLAGFLSPLWVQRQVALLDPLEVQMFYHVHLATELALPARPKSMRFGNMAEVTPAELAAAKAYVLEQEKTLDMRESIEKQAFWGDFLQRKYPQAFSELSTEHQERMDTVYSGRTELTDEDYMTRIQAVVESRAQAIARVIKQLTEQELEQHPFSRKPSIETDV